MAESEENLFCHHCRQINGVCYNNPRTLSGIAAKTYQEQTDMNDAHEAFGKSLMRFPHGCKCPHNTAMPLAIPRTHVKTGNTSLYGSMGSSNQSKGDNGEISRLPQWSYCKAVLVNIGEFCNHIDLLCRAKNARCTSAPVKSSSHPFLRCTCIEGYIPVYQYNLGYHECFRQLLTNRSSCLQCTRTGGKCYTMNERSALATGCQCPNHRSSTFANLDVRDRNSEDTFPSIHSEENLESCAESLAEVSCFRNYLELCYKTPSQPPYNILSSHLINQRAIAFLSDSRINLNYRPECALTPVSAERLLERQRAVILNHTRIWCIQLDWRKQVENPPCGLRVTEYMSGHLYSGYLNIVINPEYAKSMENLFFRFTCKTNNEIPQQVPGQIFEHQPQLVAPLAWDNLPWSNSVRITMEVRNISGSLVETAFESTPIRLYAKLHERTGPFKAMQMEDCYISRIPNNEEDQGNRKQCLLISKSCPTPAFRIRWSPNGNAAENQHSVNTWYNPPTSLETPFFYFNHLFTADCSDGNNCLTTKSDAIGRDTQGAEGKSANLKDSWHAKDSIRLSRLRHTEYQVQQIEFACIFRICTDHAWCSWPNACQPADADPQTPRTTFIPPSIQTVTQSVRLNVVRLVTTSHKPAKTKAETAKCTSTFCEASFHVPVLLGMVGVLTCLMGVLGILLARRYRQQYQQRHVSHNRNEKRTCTVRPNSLGIAPNGSLTGSSKCGPIINSSSSDKCSSLLGRNNHLWLNLHTYSNPLVTTNLMQHDRQSTGNSGPSSVLCSCVEAGQMFDPDNGSHVLTSCRDGTIYRSLVRNNNNTVRKTEPSTGGLLRPQEMTRFPPVPLTFPIEDSRILGGKPRNPLPQTFMPLHTQPTWMHTETNATHKPEMELRISENTLTPTYVSAVRVDSNPASQFDPLNIDVHS